MEARVLTVGPDWVKLEIHPEDRHVFLEAVVRDNRAGQRYRITAAEIQDDEAEIQAQEGQKFEAGEVVSGSPMASYSVAIRNAQMASSARTATSACGILVSDAVFTDFAMEHGYRNPVEFVRAWCGVASRADIDADPVAREKLRRLTGKYLGWVQKKAPHRRG